MRGTVAEQVIRHVSGMNRLTKEWAEAHLERAGVEFDGVKFRKIGETDTPFSKQQGNLRAEVSQQEADAIAKKLLGDIVFGQAGQFSRRRQRRAEDRRTFVNKSIELCPKQSHMGSEQ